MVKSLEFHPAAFTELEFAFDWYLARDERVSARFLDEVIRAVEMITQSPQRWPVSEGNVRKFVLRRFPFLIIYRDLPSAIQIVAVAHGRRRAGYWKGRV